MVKESDLFDAFAEYCAENGIGNPYTKPSPMLFKNLFLKQKFEKPPLFDNLYVIEKYLPDAPMPSAYQVYLEQELQRLESERVTREQKAQHELETQLARAAEKRRRDYPKTYLNHFIEEQIFPSPSPFLTSEPVDLLATVDRSQPPIQTLFESLQAIMAKSDHERLQPFWRDHHRNAPPRARPAAVMPSDDLTQLLLIDTKRFIQSILDRHDKINETPLPKKPGREFI